MWTQALLTPQPDCFPQQNLRLAFKSQVRLTQVQLLLSQYFDHTNANYNSCYSIC